MKRITLILMLAFVTVAPFSLRAEDSSGDDQTSGKSAPFFRPLERAKDARDKAEERRDLIKENIGERREEFKSRFDEFKKQKLQQGIERMKKLITAAIERLRNIADRIDARIAKIEDETEEDLSIAKAHVEDAREHLDAAEAALADIETDDDSLFADKEEGSDTETEGRFGKLRTLFAEAREEIRAARTSLGEALKAIGILKRPFDRKPAEEAKTE